jgi:hypothetical protein
MDNVGFFSVGFGYCFTPQTPKHIRGGWSHYTDTSEPVDGNGAQNMVAVQSNQRPFDHWPNALTNCQSGPQCFVVFFPKIDFFYSIFRRQKKKIF